MEDWKRNLFALYEQLPADSEEVRELERDYLEELACEEILAMLEQGDPTLWPFSNPVVKVQGRTCEVVRFIVPGFGERL